MIKTMYFGAFQIIRGCSITMIANIYSIISNVIQIMLNTLHETSLNYNNPFYRTGKWNSKKLSILFEEKHYIQITFKVAFPR